MQIKNLALKAKAEGKSRADLAKELVRLGHGAPAAAEHTFTPSAGRMAQHTLAVHPKPKL